MPRALSDYGARTHVPAAARPPTHPMAPASHMHAIATATHTHDRASLMGVMRFPVPHLDVIIVGLAFIGFRLSQAAQICLGFTATMPTLV